MNRISEEWKMYAIEIGNRIYMTVNSPDMIGTDAETGYAVIFFNTRNHNGRSTLVSSMTDSDQLRKILTATLEKLDGPLASIIEPMTEQ